MKQAKGSSDRERCAAIDKKYTDYDCHANCGCSYCAGNILVMFDGVVRLLKDMTKEEQEQYISGLK